MGNCKAIEATVVFLVSTDPTGRPVVLLGRKSLHASFAAGKLVPPGGKCDAGESHEMCAIREYKEETGVVLDGATLELVADFHSYIDGKPLFHVVIYIARAYSGIPVESIEMRPEWHAIEDIPYDEMLEGDEAWVPRILRGECLIVRKHMYAGGSWAIHIFPMPTQTAAE